MAKSDGGKVTGLVKLPPRGAAALVLKMASNGAGKKTIASALGTSDKTFHAWVQEYPDIAFAYAKGQEQERVKLHHSLFRRAMDMKSNSGAAAAMFLLKARHNYRENEPVQDGARVALVFNIPAALPPEQYISTVKAINAPRESDD